jgi:hypothetical protein
MRDHGDDYVHFVTITYSHCEKDQDDIVFEERIEKNVELLVSESFLMHLVFYANLWGTTGEFFEKNETQCLLQGKVLADVVFHADSESVS